MPRPPPMPGPPTNAGKMGTPRRPPQTAVCKFSGAAALGKASNVQAQNGGFRAPAQGSTGASPRAGVAPERARALHKHAGPCCDIAMPPRQPVPAPPPRRRAGLPSVVRRRKPCPGRDVPRPPPVPGPPENAGKIGRPRRGPQTAVCQFPGAAPLGKASNVQAQNGGLRRGARGHPQGRGSLLSLRESSTSMWGHAVTLPCLPGSLCQLHRLAGGLTCPLWYAEQSPVRAETCLARRPCLGRQQMLGK